MILRRASSTSISAEAIDPRNDCLSYKYHATALTVAVIIAPIILLLFQLNDMGGYAMLYPMFLYPKTFWPWLFLMFLLALKPYRNTAEENIVANVIVSVGIALIVPFLTIAPVAYGSLFQANYIGMNFNNWLTSLGISLAYTLFCCAIYIGLIKTFSYFKENNLET